jgi:hypothetical protein
VDSNTSYRDSQGRPAVEGKIVEINPPGRPVTTFEPKWLPAEQAGAASTVVWEISGNKSKIKVTHEGLQPGNARHSKRVAAYARRPEERARNCRRLIERRSERSDGAPLSALA